MWTGFLGDATGWVSDTASERTPTGLVTEADKELSAYAPWWTGISGFMRHRGFLPETLKESFPVDSIIIIRIWTLQ